MVRLSLVIPTYNRSSQLLTTLSYVIEQSADSKLWECIIVDNNSQDDTHLTIATFIAEHPEVNLRYAFEPKQGLSHARNCGIAQSQGDIVAFIDDDESIVPEFVQSYIDLFDTHADAWAAGGRIVAQYQSGTPRWISKYVAQPIANPMDFGRKIKPFPRRRCPGGGNMAVRRELFDRIGLFDTELGRKGRSLVGGEECDLVERMREQRLPIYYVPDAVIYHRIYDEKLTEEYTKRLFFNIGVSHRLRAKGGGRMLVAYMAECCKWGATLLLCLVHRPAQSRYLVKMRWNISRGLMRGGRE